VRVHSATLAGLAVALAGAAPAAAATPSEAVDFLNQQRAANEIPAMLQVDDHLNTGCKNHDRYMEQNGFAHGEQPGKPGYTTEGADYNDIGEVLAQGGSGFTATTNPWDLAPFHQAILFSPRVNRAGYDEYKAFACMRLGFDFSSPGPSTPTFWAYTGNRGRTDVPHSITIRGEGPYAPQQAVGIPQGVATGPNILFFTRRFGSTNHAQSYALTGPQGQVDARMVDNTTPPPSGETYKPFYTGGDLIPVHPLDPFTTYNVAVTWANDDDGQQIEQKFSFKTDGILRGLRLSLSKKLAKGRKAVLKAPAEAVGQSAKVKIGLLKKGKKKAKTVSSKSISLKRSQKIKVPRPSKGGRAVVTVTVRSFTSADTRFSVKPAKRSYR
jgi:hypothetical protein